MLAEVMAKRAQLVRSMRACPDAKHLVELLERERLGLGHEQQRGEEPEYAVELRQSLL